MLKHGSLFSGIGGFDLAAQWAGFENVFQVEIDPFCQKVLEKNFPNVKRYRDIKEFNGKEYEGAVDIISGGFPCQPFSCAGKRKGKGDDRFLWPEMLRVISEIKPKYVVGENVAGIVNMELDSCLSDLESIRYATEAYIIPACAIGAPHRRDRVWIVGNSTSSRFSPGGSNKRTGHDIQTSIGQIEKDKQAGDRRELWVGERDCHACISNGKRLEEQNIRQMDCESVKSDCHAADTGCVRQTEHEIKTAVFEQCDADASHPCYKGLQGGEQSGTLRKNRGTTHDTTTQCFGSWDEPWIEVATRFCRMDDGVSEEFYKLETSDRVGRLKALGNSIIPQLAYIIFKSIRLIENGQI